MKFDSNGWLDEAIEIDYSGNSMSRQGYGIKYLVLHGTAGGTSAQGIGQFFQGTQGGSNPVSSHIIIDQQGNIVQGVPMSLAAFGNGVITNGHAAFLPDPSINPNWYTASIEFVKASTDNSDALTPIQAQVGRKVIQCICDTYNIPKRAGDVNGGIISHADIDPINRARCPGTFDWNALWAYLAGNQQEETPMIDISNPSVARYFKASADGKVWQCTNGYTVGGAILDFYKSFGGSALNGLSHLGLPLSPELGIGGGNVIQRFERGVLAYDPPRKNDNPPGLDPKVQVYTAHINSGPGEDPRVEDLTAQVASLQTSALAQENKTLQAKIDAAIKDLS